MVEISWQKTELACIRLEFVVELCLAKGNVHADCCNNFVERLLLSLFCIQAKLRVSCETVGICNRTGGFFFSGGKCENF